MDQIKKDLAMLKHDVERARTVRMWAAVATLLALLCAVLALALS